MRARSQQLLAATRVIPQPLILGGGLDVMTPPFQLKPGFCRASQNFECSIYGGYRRIAGYERADGRAKPSDATFTTIQATITGTVAVGNALHSTSGATGVVIALPGDSIIVTKVVGTFGDAEALDVGAGTIATSTAAGVTNSAPTPKLVAQYKNLAADVYRALIEAIPGSGAVLGVNVYNGILYGFRNVANGTAAAMYKATASGWSLVALGRQLRFTTGNAAVAEGATLTGASSGASAVVTRVALATGTYGASSAAGIFTFASVTNGPFTNGENLQVGGVTKAVASGGDAAITLLPDGRYEFVNDNFTGSTDTKRMYGCDGVNKAFEFDGTVFVPITTGMTNDAPTYIAFHLYHLVLSFFASTQISTPGFPYQWTLITGAAELAMGDNVTGYAVQPAGTAAAALAVFTRRGLSILYGTVASDFVLLGYKQVLGGIAHTMQQMAQTTFLDIWGITDLATTLAFGNFSHAVLSNPVKAMLTGWRNAAIASSISRDLSQYRLFFTNGYGFYVAMIGKKVIGIMPVLFPNIVRCACQEILSDNSEVSYFGSDDGMVYQFDKGTSFDGADIEASINLAYNFSGAQRLLKRYRNGALEVSGSGYGEFQFGYSLGYNSTDYIQPSTQSIITNFSSGLWDVGNWDTGIWDGVTLSPSSFEMDGEAENVSVSILSRGDYFDPFTISGGVLHITPRREIR